MQFAQKDLGVLLSSLLSLRCPAHWSNLFPVLSHFLRSQAPSTARPSIAGCSRHGSGTERPVTHVEDSSSTVTHLNSSLVRNQGRIIRRNGSDCQLMYNAVSTDFSRAVLLCNHKFVLH